MFRSPGTLIALTEAAYDLDVPVEAWLAHVLSAGLPLFDHGLGFGGIVATKPVTAQTNIVANVHQTHVATGSEDFLARHYEVAASLPPEQTHRQTQTGAFVLSKMTSRAQLEFYKNHVGGGVQDAVGVTALDPDGFGVQLLGLTPHVVTLGRGDRRALQMIAAHLSAGVRLRRALSDTVPAKTTPPATSDLPAGAEAVIDPRSFEVSEAVGEGKRTGALRSLREAATRIDRARGRLRHEDPEQALEAWKGLVQGRWSLVDWFDTDDRRYVVALANPPTVGNPRGLTERERQVLGYAALGESRKHIAYRLGIAPNTAATTLRFAMRKLGIRTQAELVHKLRGLEPDPRSTG